ncbi:MAG: hypothetical protein EZS28_037482, partial [Streblomastix strix]
IGTMLVVLVIVSLKTCREVVSDSFFAKEFDILPAVLNQSETAFLRMINNQLLIEEDEYKKLFDEIMEIMDTKGAV